MDYFRITVGCCKVVHCIFGCQKVDMGDNPEQQFEWALKNGDMDQVKSIVGKVMSFDCHAGQLRFG